MAGRLVKRGARTASTATRTTPAAVRQLHRHLHNLRGRLLLPVAIPEGIRLMDGDPDRPELAKCLFANHASSAA